MVIVEVPPGARRHGAEQCSEPAGFLREFVAVQTGAVEVEVVVPADAGEHADDHRLAGKFQTMLTRMTAEAQILFGVASRPGPFRRAVGSSTVLASRNVPRPSNSVMPCSFIRKWARSGAGMSASAP